MRPLHTTRLPPYDDGKCVKKKVLYSKYYATFDEFQEAISDCLRQTHTTHKLELDSLLALNFQTFKKCEFVPI